MEVTSGGEVTVEIALSGHEGKRAVLSDTLPDGFSFVPGSIGGGGLPDLSGNRISVVLGDVGTVTEISYKAMAPDDPVVHSSLAVASSLLEIPGTLVATSRSPGLRMPPVGMANLGPGLR